MSFEIASRTIAVESSALAELFSALAVKYGELVPDGGRMVHTIGVFWDDEAQTRNRAASFFDGTITGTPLSDGRIAFQCRWQSDLAAAFDSGAIEGAEELTEAEFEILAAIDATPTEE